MILDPEEVPVAATAWTAQERARIERLCAVLTGDPDAAPDLAQETLLQAWRIRDRLTDPAGSGPWLDAVARHVCRRWRVDAARRHAREQLTAEEPAPGWRDPLRDPLADLLERHELGELLDRALRLLPAETREVLVGRYVEDRLPHQLAARLGSSPEAVSMRLVRGRARLRELLETELADEPLAAVWRSRYGVSWRATRLRCPDCGRATIAYRRDDHRAVVELRCTACTPLHLSAAYRLDNPVLGGLLRDARRPSTVVGRMAAWAAEFWPAATAGGPVSCTRCGAPVAAAPYHREDPLDPRTRRGWVVSCAACGEQLSTSLAGLALALPETRALRAVRPALCAEPSRATSLDGRPALVVGFRDPGSGDSVEMVVDDATSRPVAVAATGARTRRLAPR